MVRSEISADQCPSPKLAVSAPAAAVCRTSNHRRVGEPGVREPESHFAQKALETGAFHSFNADCRYSDRVRTML
jgi:hypothetical protein